MLKQVPPHIGEHQSKISGTVGVLENSYEARVLSRTRRLCHRPTQCATKAAIATCRSDEETEKRRTKVTKCNISTSASTDLFFRRRSIYVPVHA